MTLLFAVSGVSAATRPNIIFILVDDMPWWGTSVEQQEGNPQSTSIYRVTPNIEKLAARGMTFSNAYAAAGMCAPSRASIQTGLSPARHLFSGNGNFGDSAPSEVFYGDGRKKFRNQLLMEPSPIGTLNSEFITIGEALKKQGYATAHVGKWHVYGGGPERHGYDLSDGETSNDEGKPTSDIDPRDPKRIFSITEKGLKFAEQQHKLGKPFFIQLSHYVEHNKQMSLPETMDSFLELESIKAIKEKAASKEASTHGAAVKDLDTSVGLILERLEELGIRENTYVIFTSDNGKGLYNGKESILRGDKWWLWEAGIRVPFMIEGPGIQPGSRSSANIVGYDLLPTFYEIAGGKTKELGDIDGSSILSLFTNKQTRAFANRALYFHYPHMRTSTPHSAIIKGDYKLYTFYEIPDQPHLYKLSDDLGEARNLALQMPEKTQDMLGELTTYFDRVGAYFPKPNPNAGPNIQRFDPEKQMPPLSRKVVSTKGKKKKSE
ncbi:MAG: sulfatase [Verrucomicrobiota bacterium]